MRDSFPVPTPDTAAWPQGFSAPCHCDGDEFCRQCHPALVTAGYCCESLWRVGTCTCPDREQEVGW